MEYTLKNVKEIKQNASPLERKVLNYIIDEWRNYDNKEHIFTDVLYYGCQAGTVGFLIYYSDTVKFYKKYKPEIDSLLYETMESTGLYSLSDLFGDKWDKEDPLASDVYNQNLLAWFGFEETMRNIGYKFEQLQNKI